MQFGFISYLEEGNILKPKKKRIEFVWGEKISSVSLSKLSMQENLSNCDSGYFIVFNEKKKVIMAYVDNERNVKIFDVFSRKVINDVKDLRHKKKIVCLDYYSFINEHGEETKFLATIALDNTMIISDLSINEKNSNKILLNIGDTFKEDQPNNTFCISTIRNNNTIWIITSYYYDKNFKIFNKEGELLHRVPNED